MNKFEKEYPQLVERITTTIADGRCVECLFSQHSTICMKCRKCICSCKIKPCKFCNTSLCTQCRYVCNKCPSTFCPRCAHMRGDFGGAQGDVFCDMCQYSQVY